MLKHEKCIKMHFYENLNKMTTISHLKQRQRSYLFPMCTLSLILVASLFVPIYFYCFVFMKRALLSSWMWMQFKKKNILLKILPFFNAIKPNYYNNNVNIFTSFICFNVHTLVLTVSSDFRAATFADWNEFMSQSRWISNDLVRFWFSFRFFIDFVGMYFFVLLVFVFVFYFLIWRVERKTKISAVDRRMSCGSLRLIFRLNHRIIHIRACIDVFMH